MGTRSRKFSHSIFVKLIVFLLMLACVAGSIHATFNMIKITNGYIEIIFEKNYIESTTFKMEYDSTINQLADLIDIYISEENILEGHTINKDEREERVDEMYWKWNGDDEATSQTKAVEKQEEAITKEMEDRVRKEMIAEDLENFQMILNNLDKEKGLIYYVTNGEATFTNTKQTNKEQFEKYPIYYISEGYDWKMYPSNLEQYSAFYGGTHIYRATDPENTKIYVGYTDSYVEKYSSEWNEKKTDAMRQLYYLLISVIVFCLSLLYLIVTTGRDSFRDEHVHMHVIDRPYIEINMMLLIVLPWFWFVFMNEAQFYYRSMEWILYSITLLGVAICTILLLSLIRHVKNKTFFKHSIIYIVFRWLYQLVKDIYDSGSVGMKIVIALILYPLITAASLFFFPITIGVAVWLALKKVKDFNKIQVGAELMREGNLQHYIDIDGKGEFSTLASNINGINEGFKQAVHNELKNERLKTELITNVSHDIRTPLTSLITYTDLLKTETDPEKVREYIEILDQKSKRLKVLTDDLFAAAKASSGDIPIDLQKIDVVALVNQGIGEVSELISAQELDFKLNYPEEKMYVTADGKLLWRAIENVLSNIFNYALEGSRVYIDILVNDEQTMTMISFKNISKYELNITEEELMERFKRGDESRTSQGSGLGLSITKSLIENQNGTFEVNIDGDLFKSMISLPTLVEDDLSTTGEETPTSSA